MPKYRSALLAGCALSHLAFVAGAENFTTAAEVKPILMITKPQWIAVRPFDGNDLLYFTNLLAWRCGLQSVSYSINGGVSNSLVLEPCHEDTAQPNAMLDETVLPYVTLPLASIETVKVIVTFDDETTVDAEYLRGAVLMP